MIDRIRKFLATITGRVCAAVACLCIITFVGFQIRQLFAGDPLGERASYATYVDSATGIPFKHKNQLGEVPPIVAPSGGRTGLRAEACYWNADGTTRSEPTWVLLNEQLGKTGPTFCPDCGRLVTGHNPKPVDGVKPPPIQADYKLIHNR